MATTTPLNNLAFRDSRHEFMFFGLPPARIDLLREIPGVEFGPAFARRVDVVWDGVKVHILGREDLGAAKKAAGRERDLRDLRTLAEFEYARTLDTVLLGHGSGGGADPNWALSEKSFTDM